MSSSKYCGRFAPSPTGELHFGSLVTAVASYLEACVNSGEWLLRIDDIDTKRVKKGSIKKQIDKLETLGFEWDREISYQSNNKKDYENALNKLTYKNSTYFCKCSRKTILAKSKKIKNNLIYPNSCKDLKLGYSKYRGIRVKTKNKLIKFNDGVYGPQSQNIEAEIGDFLIRRSDQCFSYQLAVVVDDSKFGVTDVVRGSDLLDSTARQIYLYELLENDHPRYAHIPVVKDKQGKKVSKSTQNDLTSAKNPIEILSNIWRYLNQPEHSNFHSLSLEDFWLFAKSNWDLKRISDKTINEG